MEMPRSEGDPMYIGEQRRTWFVEPIEEHPVEPERKPDPQHEPIPSEAVHMPEPQPAR